MADRLAATCLALLRDLHDAGRHDPAHILEEPTADQRRVLKQLGELERATGRHVGARSARFLQEVYDIPARSRSSLIAHGIPDMPFVDPNFYKDQFGVEGKFVALTFGLLSPNKGIEYVLRALPRVIREYPDFVYIVLGATHPNLVREQGEALPDQPGAAGARLGPRRAMSFSITGSSSSAS